MNIDLKMLKRFTALAETRNFTRAAELLHMAQPALSKQIQKLESDVGAKLLVRGVRPLQLTPAGRRFYDDARAVLERCERMVGTARRSGSTTQRLVVIGFSPTITYSGLPTLLRALSNSSEHYAFRPMEVMSPDQGDALRSGLIDIGFGYSDDWERDTEVKHLRDERLCVAMPKDAEFASETGELPLSALEGQVLILYPDTPAPSSFDRIWSMVKGAGVSPRDVYEVRGLATALTMTAAGYGLSIVPESARWTNLELAYRSLPASSAVLPVTMRYRSNEESALLSLVEETLEQQRGPISEHLRKSVEVSKPPR
ncbi:DNA-binding transcriptional LysR family regulator [Paraburkholderia sp. GAS199]|uniref:LysR family transcriptional regulator n=1 Tax=Paraburkholderia sp. GAS199 TaxID=3035126 RepID=UPI003D20B192